MKQERKDFGCAWAIGILALAALITWIIQHA